MRNNRVITSKRPLRIFVFGFFSVLVASTVLHESVIGVAGLIVIKLFGDEILDAVTYRPRRKILNVPTPPIWAERIGSLFVEPKQRLAILGDREERFHREAKQFGLKRAKWFYWRDVLVSAAPFIFAWLKRAGIVGLIWKALTK